MDKNHAGITLCTRIYSLPPRVFILLVQIFVMLHGVKHFIFSYIIKKLAIS